MRWRVSLRITWGYIFVICCVLSVCLQICNNEYVDNSQQLGLHGISKTLMLGDTRIYFKFHKSVCLESTKQWLLQARVWFECDCVSKHILHMYLRYQPCKNHTSRIILMNCCIDDIQLRPPFQSVGDWRRLQWDSCKYLHRRRITSFAY